MFYRPIAIATLAFAAFGVHAMEDSSNPCSLLNWQDLQSFGIKADTGAVDAGWHAETTPAELAGSQLFTNMCAYTLKTDAGKTSISLNFDSFVGKVSAEQVGAWIKSSLPAEPEQGVQVVAHGETTCESGRYQLPTEQRDGSIADIMQHYVACDTQVGIQHVSLNIHVPEKNKALLPNTERVKELLDKSVSRMKQNGFAPPLGRKS